MGKRKVEFDYSANNELIVCYVNHNGYLGVGVAEFKEDGIEEHPTKLTGETVAHLKAERDVLKQKLQDKKVQLKYIADFCTYMFPKKYDKALEDWLYIRKNKKIVELMSEINALKTEIEEIDNTIKEYLQDKEDFLKRLKKKREGKKNDNSSNK